MAAAVHAVVEMATGHVAVVAIQILRGETNVIDARNQNQKELAVVVQAVEHQEVDPSDQVETVSVKDEIKIKVQDGIKVQCEAVVIAAMIVIDHTKAIQLY